MRSLTARQSNWPLAKQFVIARGSRTEAQVIQVAISEGDHLGLGECVPYGRYGESLESVNDQIESVRDNITNGINHNQLQQLLPPGAARNALDCALWDLEAKLASSSVAELTHLGQPAGLVSAQTLSIDSIENMAKEAALYKNYPLLKVKLDNQQVVERMYAIHQAAPKAQFIIDANESWDIDLLNTCIDKLQQWNVILIEQPLAADKDKALLHYQGDIPLCADESCHTSAEVEALADRYQVINIKLDKTGGLTEAMQLLKSARQLGLLVMTGCMVGTSLAMAPATLVAQHSDFVDLDGPALLAEDVAQGFRFTQGNMSPLNPRLWGN